MNSTKRSETYNLKNVPCYIIFTWDDEETFDAEGVDIKVIPAWKWLLVGAIES